MIVSVFVLLITVLAASLLTGTITNRSIKSILNAPLAAPAYDELSPLLLRMEKQNARITSKSANCESNRRNSTI